MELGLSEYKICQTENVRKGDQELLGSFCERESSLKPLQIRFFQTKKDQASTSLLRCLW